MAGREENTLIYLEIVTNLKNTLQLFTLIFPGIVSSFEWLEDPTQFPPTSQCRGGNGGPQVPAS